MRASVSKSLLRAVKDEAQGLPTLCPDNLWCCCSQQGFDQDAESLLLQEAGQDPLVLFGSEEHRNAHAVKALNHLIRLVGSVRPLPLFVVMAIR